VNSPNARFRVRSGRVTAMLCGAALVAAIAVPVGTAAAQSGHSGVQSPLVDVRAIGTPPADPTPSDEPTGDPTATPTLTHGTPTETPTQSPTDSPTKPPTSKPPHTQPPTTPPDEPPPGATVPSGPVIDGEAAAAFALATEHLHNASAALDLANARIAAADKAWLAIGHARRAEGAVRVAVDRLAVVMTALQRERSRVSAAAVSLGGSARRAYVGGPSAGLTRLLDADGLADVAQRLGTIQSVDRASGQVVGQLDSARSTVSRLEAALQRAQTDLRDAEAERDGLVAQAKRITTDANAARAALPALQRAVDDAIAEARAAIPADQALAAQRGAESNRLAAEILAASKRLDAQGGMVDGTGSFGLPGTGPITSPYGWRVHPILGYLKLHTGVDYAGDDGVVYAVDDGVVLLTVWSSAYGNVTVIDHGRPGGRYFATFYAHQAGFFVKPGDVVHKGQPIGAVGATGLATGPHVHFEVRLDGQPVDPMPFLDGVR
jgi:murein DD-endopeptidase MepM/ murein hydrolase activator NlpD